MTQRIAISLPILILAALLAGIALQPAPAAANAGPHGNYAALTDACAGCHRSHTGPGAPLLYSAATGNTFCYTCHDGSGASPAPVVSTHGNSNFPGGTEGAFSLQCSQCHDPHGNPANLFSVHQDVVVQEGATPVTAGPVTFTAASGPNSYDDGSGPPAGRICTACHTDAANTGYPMTNHDGAAGHGGGWDFTAEDCTACHPHSADADINTVDGFMPSGGCTRCHALPQGSRRAIVNEFGETSHHVQGPVQDGDCKACHDIGAHEQGQVILRNADNPATLYPYTGDPAALEPFCLACHDGNGAGGAAPFSDGLMPPVVDSTLWTAATHAGTYTCFDCHAGRHGSVKANLLTPYNATPDPSLPGDPLRQEEGFCYTCHGPSGPAAVDIQAQFGRATHHNVSSLEQADGSKIECVNCHNPHTVTAAAKRSNPDDTTLLWVGSGVAFCQTCHDGAPPAAVSFPPASPGTGYDKSTYLGDHASQLGGDSCRRCHGDHGEDFGSILPDQYVVADYNNYATNDYAMCWRCHSENAVVGNKAKNAFDDLHDKHVKGEDTPCVACHDTHRPHDSGESGLISFDYAVKNGFDFQYIDGRNGTTAFWIDTNQNKGYCYLRCHGKDHTPKDYNRAPADTVTACTGCHGGPQDDGDGVPAGGRRAIVAEFGKSSHHVQGQLQDADCQTCHRERVGNGNHKNDVVELVNADSGANYAETSAGAYRAPTNPTDLSNLTAFCQSCHDADGANGNMAPLSGGQSPPLAGMHANTDFGAPAEANFQVDCIRCHNGHGADNRSLVKTTVLIAGSATAGPVVFTALNGTDSFDEDDGGADADDLCAACHIDAANPGYPMTNHTGGPGHGGGNYAGVQCTTCHLHDADNDPATRDGFMPVPTCIGCHTLPQDDGDGLPAGGRRPVVDEFGNTSHHIQGAAQNSDCRACHRENYGAANHMNDVVQVRHADTGANLTETAPGAFRFPVNPTDISNLTTFCQSCHDGDGAQRLGTPMTPFSDGQTPASVSLHSNIDYSGGAEANFQVECAQCHLAHGSSNLSNINPTLLVDVATAATTGPIALTALSGTDSFDEDDGGADADDLCAACHVNAANPGYPTLNHPGGPGHMSGASYAGQNCTTCHAHNEDTNAATRDGFMPTDSCVVCHAGPMGSRRPVVDEFGYSTHHVQGPVQDSDCQACHDTANHQSGQVVLKNADTPATTYAYTTPADLEPFCLACHDGNGAGGAAPFSDGIMPPVIDGAVYNSIPHGTNATCYDCHNNGHGTNNTFMLKNTYVTADYTPYNIPDYQLCWGCHIETKVVGNKAQNAFDDLHDKHVKGEDTPCIMCHNAHAPHDTGEAGLITFEYGINNGFDIQYIGGRDASTSFWINGNRGYCYLRCHGKDHTPKNYNRDKKTNTTQRVVSPRPYVIYLPIITKGASLKGHAPNPTPTPTPTPVPVEPTAAPGKPIPTPVEPPPPGPVKPTPPPPGPGRLPLEPTPVPLD